MSKWRSFSETFSRLFMRAFAEVMLAPVRLLENFSLVRCRSARPVSAIDAPTPSLLGILMFFILLNVPIFWLIVPLLTPSLRLLATLPLLPFIFLLASLFERIRIGLLRIFVLELLPEHVLKVKDLRSTFKRIEILAAHPLLAHQLDAKKILNASAALYDELLNDFKSLRTYAQFSISSLSVSLRALELDRRALIVSEAEEALVFMLREAQHLALKSPLGAVSEASATHLSSLLTNSEFTRFCHQQNHLSTL